ncbi:NAC domain protein, partial [Trifolium medium]|nr:NAC domain protein [Trifolium medium]
QEEWVVCRIFKKSGSGKKYPCNSNSNHTRAGLNPYSMQEIGSSNMVPIPPQMMQYYLQGLHGDPSTHFLYGRSNSNYINGSNAEVLRAGIMQSHQMNYPSILPATTGEEGGGFSISGLNLNLGATTTTQTILRPMQHSQYAMADNVSSINMNMNSVGADQNINNFVGYNGMEHCMDLETYWPNSY